MSKTVLEKQTYLFNNYNPSGKTEKSAELHGRNSFTNLAGSFKFRKRDENRFCSRVYIYILEYISIENLLYYCMKGLLF